MADSTIDEIAQLLDQCILGCQPFEERLWISCRFQKFFLERIKCWHLKSLKAWFEVMRFRTFQGKPEELNEILASIENSGGAACLNVDVKQLGHPWWKKGFEENRFFWCFFWLVHLGSESMTMYSCLQVFGVWEMSQAVGQSKTWTSMFQQ